MEPRLNLVFYISLFLTIFFGAFLFEVKISTGGDDSHYIEMANDFIKGPFVSHLAWTIISHFS